MKANPIVWFEIYVQDMPRVKTFYQAVFQGELTPLANPDQAAFPGLEMWAFPRSMESYGVTGALVKMPGFSSTGNSTLVYFGCEDCAVESARAVANGGAYVQRKSRDRRAWLYRSGF